MPLRWRMFALLALLAGLVVANTALTLSSGARLSEQERMQEDLHETALVAERLQRSLEGQVVEVRGFALSADRSFLLGYGRKRIAEQQLVDRLQRLLGNQTALLDRLDRLESAILDWRVRVADPLIAANVEGRAITPVLTRLDEPLFERVRAEALALSRGIGARLAAIEVTVEAARDRLDRQLLTTAGLAVLLVAGSTWGLRRWITVPVAQLTAQVRRVADGELQEPVHGSGPVEFERLGDHVELMRRRIVEDLEETKRAVEALEQNAPLVASLRAQLSAGPERGLPGSLRIVGRLEPADGVLAGDWYDVLHLEDDRVVLIVVDVCGHGPQAGLRALWLKHLLVPALMLGLEPGEALTWVAGQMGDTGEWFATCVIVEIDGRTGRCRYANAGHPPPLLIGPDGVRLLEATGTLFGALLGERWETADASLSSHHMLVVYTDGITETRNAAGDEFGDQRLISCFRANTAHDPAAIADDVMESVHTFGTDRLKDDATLAVVSLADTDGA
jgi:serine phosphatase RsbU (regulator of sigma subunit)/CHASE3 domain sensor protein